MLKSGRYPIRLEYADVQVENGQPIISVTATLVHAQPPTKITFEAKILLPKKEQAKAAIQDQVMEYVAMKWGHDTAVKFSQATMDRSASYWENYWLPNLQVIDLDLIAEEVDNVLHQD